MASSALAGLAFGSNDPEPESRTRVEEPVEELQVEDTVVHEQRPDAAEVESKARNVGWRPRDQFRGDPKLWVDATAYLKRADEVMPLLKTENRRLESRLHDTEGALTSTKQELESLRESVEGLKQFRETTVKQNTARDKEGLIDAILAAREAGNTRLEIELNAELSAVMARPEPVEKPAVKTAEPPAKKPPAETAEFREWRESNPWWTEDPVKRAVATELTRKLSADGRFNGLSQAEALSLITRETEKYLGVKTVPNGSKVGGARTTGSGGGGGSPNGRSWMDLPANAKQAAERQANKYKLVGKGRAFENAEAWQRFYANDYFSSGTPVEIIET